MAAAPLAPSTATPATPTTVPGASTRVPVDATAVGSLHESLKHLVDHSAYEGATKDQLAPSEVRADAIHSHGPAEARKWISHFYPSSDTLDHLFAHEHMGNYVIDRNTGAKIFETMPIYVRVGMHLLFVSGNEFMGYSKVEKLLEEQSTKQGAIYDKTGEGVLQHIHSFIKTYELPLQELLVQDLTQYPTFNSFFARKLLATARPITSPQDPTIITSPADCRLSAFPSVEASKTLWIKGKEFTIPNLLMGTNSPTNFPTNPKYEAILRDGEATVAVCRLAPQDYHRFHSPVFGTVVDITDIPGQLYTVNPQAVNEDLNVFTLNKRSVCVIRANLGPGREAVPMAFVAIGAMLVGSIGWSKKPGDTIAKGEELGWFQYGGSTTIVVFPASAGVKFDDDLLATSERKMETLVCVGMEIARTGVQPVVAQAGPVA